MLVNCRGSTQLLWGRRMPDVATSAAASWFPAFTALLGSLLGFVTAVVSEWLKDRRASAREREAREAERRMRLSERRRNFQRETLLPLQDAVAKLTRAAGRINHLDKMTYYSTGKWGGFQLPADLDDDAHYANVTLMVLTSRVRDDCIRKMVNTFRSHASCVGITVTEQAEKEAIQHMLEVRAGLGKLDIGISGVSA